MDQDQADSTIRQKLPASLRAEFRRLKHDGSTSIGAWGLIVVAASLMALVWTYARAEGHTAASARGDGSAALNGQPFALMPGQPRRVASTGGIDVSQIAFVAPAAAVPLFYKGGGEDRERALDCLSMAGWYEAGNDRPGQRAVMQVVLNRLRHPAFPKTVCGVVFQGSHLRTGCQFTFTCDGSRVRRQPSRHALAEARKIAEKALDGGVDAAVGAATHYHADFVVPWWSHKLQPVSKVGAHIFYSWKGAFGRLPQGVPVTSGEPNIPDFDPSRLAVASTAEAAIPEISGRVALEAKTLTPNVATANAPATSLPNFLIVDPSGATGRWAVEALGRCGSSRNCLVVAYGNGQQAAGYTSDQPSRSPRPLFVFVRDANSGMDLALWDCERFSRPNTDQCLPRNAGSLDRLMRPRS